MYISKCAQVVTIRDREVQLKSHEVIVINRPKKWLPEELHKEIEGIGMELVK